MPTLRELREVLPNLNTNARTFGESLIASVVRQGFATERQKAKLNELWEQANRPAQAKATVGSLARIMEMFSKASESLKNPFVKFAGQDGTHFKVSPAKAHSNNAGCLYVKSKGGAYLGKITPEGQYLASREVPSTSVAAIAAALQQFAANPEEAAKMYGKQFGECCFCSRELTDKRSITAGYGPICADKFGLAWG